jgi:hypothetical protein
MTCMIRASFTTDGCRRDLRLILARDNWKSHPSWRSISASSSRILATSSRGRCVNIRLMQHSRYVSELRNKYASVSASARCSICSSSLLAIRLCWFDMASTPSNILNPELGTSVPQAARNFLYCGPNLTDRHLDEPEADAHVEACLLASTDGFHRRHPYGLLADRPISSF